MTEQEIIKIINDPKDRFSLGFQCARIAQELENFKGNVYETGIFLDNIDNMQTICNMGCYLFDCEPLTDQLQIMKATKIKKSMIKIVAREQNAE